MLPMVHRQMHGRFVTQRHTRAPAAPPLRCNTFNTKKDHISCGRGIHRIHWNLPPHRLEGDVVSGMMFMRSRFGLRTVAAARGAFRWCARFHPGASAGGLHRRPIRLGAWRATARPRSVGEIQDHHAGSGRSGRAVHRSPRRRGHGPHRYHVRPHRRSDRPARPGQLRGCTRVLAAQHAPRPRRAAGRHRAGHFCMPTDCRHGAESPRRAANIIRA